MFDDSNLISKILKRPSAALIVKEVQQKLKDERQRRQEFYDIITEDDKAEFVNGEIMFHSPVVKIHNDVTGNLYKLLDTYVEEKGIGWVGVEKILTQFTRNDYEPDICYFGIEKTAKFKSKQLLFPVPDFVVEVLSKSSKKTIEHDTKTKYNDYEMHGVPEYWIVDPHEKTVKQFILENKKYRLVELATDGVIRCQTIQGFNIPTAAIFDGKENRKALKAILNSAK